MEVLSHESEYTIEDCQMALKTAFSEREYERSLAKATQLLDMEMQRACQTEQLILQFENESLQYQLGRVKQELNQAGSNESDTRASLLGMTHDRNRLQTAVHAASREIEGLRRELAITSNTTLESRNLASENRALSNQLASMQSEVERLRSQETLQPLLAENQSLVHQIKALEVEFDHEKQAHRATLSRVIQQTDEISALTKRAEEQRKQLLAEARQAPVAPQQTQTWETEKIAFQEKIETLNRKLKIAKEQLQEAEKSLKTNSRLASARSSGPAEQSKPNPVQHFARRINTDLTIATPGAVRIKDRKKQSTALPGDKSAFSITPFLNRTGGQHDSPGSSQDEGNEAGEIDDAHETSYLDGKIQDESQDEPPQERRQGPGKQRLNKSMAPKKGSRLRPADDDDDSDEAGRPTASLAQSISQAQARTKKRKLGAQSKMVIEDEGEDLEPMEVRKPGRKLALGLGRNTSLQAPGFGGFGGFSPLKRDRKQV
ncbi:hypothetical protein BO70DRAFT_333340 [Aspergillus heteromorphus CBS 117.55]|uniref:Uncharacterized protein n=1 Tax=Aspergillus heteromorphus CBS 117.55 TaxID=1448321 RepID=A0A317WPL5_9EURO|nr:uncharacterized protein BO70DRAFT_333340 [Aspergillus heteromorphus CBS 117.55]PWY86828.1 hypothetical protein BO70DRAFT_333340 [Aspergillus heteromorphus CBS 117.55]